MVERRRTLKRSGRDRARVRESERRMHGYIYGGWGAHELARSPLSGLMQVGQGALGHPSSFVRADRLRRQLAQRIRIDIGCNIAIALAAHAK